MRLLVWQERPVINEPGYEIKGLQAEFLAPKGLRFRSRMMNHPAKDAEAKI